MSVSKKYILAIDQGTSSTKSLIFDDKGKSVAKGVELLNTSYHSNGFVEQDPEEIYQNVLSAVKKCIEAFKTNGGDLKAITSLGISNQRETFVVWDESGNPLHNAIVWQCKRSVDICERLKKEGLEDKIRKKTGLVADPYFSGTKLIWLNENSGTVKTTIENGKAWFGTIDSWLLYKLTNGRQHATDYTNASRTLFFNIHTLQWDQELLAAFGLTKIHLPEIKPSSHLFGETDLNGILENKIPITSLIGDSHAAAFGEGCFETGTGKATLGTGCSILINTGDKPVESAHGMMTTICWSTDSSIAYALEGVIVSCGSTIEWLKNEMQLFQNISETSELAQSISDNGGVYLIPAFSGLGSPHWEMDGQAILSGLSFGTGRKHILRAALESIPYQIKDVISAMEKDLGVPVSELMINGGMTSNEFVMQFIADLLNIKINSGDMQDVSALGAAYLAGLYSGLYESIDELKTLNSHNRIFSAGNKSTIAKIGYEGWLNEISNYKQRKPFLSR